MTSTQLDSPEFHALLTPDLKILSSMFSKYGYELRIAGGAVRDLLSGKQPHDVDFATTATPEEMKDMFTKEKVRMINNKGEDHGTITARINDKENYEVTTLRIDKVTDGRRAEVEFTKDWELDANRRDLTINSMFLGLDGTVYDYFSGREDLKARRVRFVGDPVQRIQEDYLRILRYFRFYGRIAASPNEHCQDTLEAIRNNAAGLERVSGERIWTEWQKILAGTFAGELTRCMVDLGMSPQIGLPLQPNVEELDRVWTQSQELGIRLEPMSLLVSLLRSESEVMDFHNRLKLSCLERDLGIFVILHRDKVPDPSIPLRPYQWLAVDSKAKINDTRMFIDQVLHYRGDLALAEEFKQWELPRFPVRGDHLKEGGCPPGRMMSVVLSKLKQHWKEANFQIELDDLVSKIPGILESIDPAEIVTDKNKGGPRLSSKERKRLRKESR